MASDPTVCGSISLVISDDCEDHHSLMSLFQRAITRDWLSPKDAADGEREYWEMIQESLLECPTDYLWDTIKGIKQT